jgi:hypothetical protein
VARLKKAEPQGIQLVEHIEEPVESHHEIYEGGSPSSGSESEADTEAADN